MEKFKVEFAGETYDVGYINRIEEAHKAIELLSRLYPKDSKDVLGIDIETCPLPGYELHGKGGLSPQLSSIATVQIYAPNEKCVFLFHVGQLPYGIACLSNFIETRSFVAHNAQFETQFLLHNGIVPKPIGCSMLLFRLLLCAITPEASSIKTTLENLVHTAFKVPMSKAEQTSTWGTKVLTAEQKSYAAIDCIATLKCAVWCVDRIKERGLESLIGVYKINKDAQIGLCSMMLAGVGLDNELHTTLIAEWNKEEEDSKLALKQMLPENLNLNSSKQLSDWITAELSKTPEGKLELAEWPRSEKTQNLVCDSETLEQFSNLDIVAPLLRHKKVSKLLSTYGPTLNNCINPVTKKIHCSYSQAFTATGRLSAYSPNMTNIPRGDFKKIFKADPKHKLVAADFSMVEMRVVAHISKDEKMLSALAEGIDLYKFSASLMLRKPIEQITKAERNLQKAVLLGFAFGLGHITLAKYARGSYGVEMSEVESKQMIKALRNLYPTLRQYQIDCTNEASQSLITKTIAGKVRALPEDAYYCKALNTPVQGTAAEILLQSIINIDKAIRENNMLTKLILAVHDELVLHVPDSEVDEAVEHLQESMEQAMLASFPEASLKNLVDVKIGDTWADTK